MRAILAPDLGLLLRLGSLGLETPLIYGGISSCEHAVQVIQLGADRVSIDQILHNSPHEVRKMASTLGAQALIASVPIRFSNNILLRYDYLMRSCYSLDDQFLALLKDGTVSELMLIDSQNEGGITRISS